MKAQILETYKPSIIEAWETMLPTLLQQSTALAPMLHHHLHVVGKMLRPSLTVAFYELLQSNRSTGSEDLSQVIQAALALELLHNGTLIHDDLQDGDETRRHQPTVWKQFSPYQAINAGNALYFHSQRLLATLSLPAETVQQLSLYLANYAIAIIDGQAQEKLLWPKLQEASEGRIFPGLVQEEAQAFYLQIVQKKTSALFSLPLLIAGTIAGEDPETLAGIDAVADPLGALFQIQDDLLDLYGDKGRDSAGNDIAEGKPSLPALQCIYMASTEDATRLYHLIQQPREQTSHRDIGWAIDIIRESGALQHSIDTIDRLRSQALQCCRELPLRVPSTPLADFLDSLCDTILQPIAHLYP